MEAIVSIQKYNLESLYLVQMYKYQIINKLIENLQKEDSKLRVQDIANEIGISKGMLDQVKSGRSTPTVEVAEKIGKYFKKDMNFFFDSIDPNLNNTVVSSPVVIYEPPKDRSDLLNIMYEQQVEITNQQKEITDLVRECERLKNVIAQGLSAKAG